MYKTGTILINFLLYFITFIIKNSLESVRFVMFLKEVPLAFQSCMYLIKNTVKIEEYY